MPAWVNVDLFINLGVAYFVWEDEMNKAVLNGLDVQGGGDVALGGYTSVGVDDNMKPLMITVGGSASFLSSTSAGVGYSSIILEPK